MDISTDICTDICTDIMICTDISKDGMLAGPSFEVYQNLLEQQPGIKLIASGGISEFDELPKLKQLGCEGTIIGKAIYENRISLKELEKFILHAFPGRYFPSHAACMFSSCSIIVQVKVM